MLAAGLCVCRMPCLPCCAVVWPACCLCELQVRDKAAEKELAELRKANKEGRKERQQQLDAAWGEDD